MSGFVFTAMQCFINCGHSVNSGYVSKMREMENGSFLGKGSFVLPSGFRNHSLFPSFMFPLFLLPVLSPVCPCLDSLAHIFKIYFNCVFAEGGHMCAGPVETRGMH